MNKVLYAAVDVDDKCFHVSLRSDDDSGDVYTCQSRPNAQALLDKLHHYQKTLSCDIKICYEATYIGYTLKRKLETGGIHCDIIAPSLIPKSPGDKVKTDRLDANKLSLLYQKGLLTSIHTPSQKEEAIRALVRSRRFLKSQLKDLKLHTLAQLRLLDLNYRQESSYINANYWTNIHINWIKAKINKLEEPYQKSNLSILMFELDSLEQKIALYEQEIDKASKEPEYEARVQSLLCYRGIDTLSAMTLVAELGDIRRFKKPAQITSYAGMDLREYSSGGKERKYSMTKSGNKNIRTTVIESCQLVLGKPVISKRLKERRKQSSLESIEIADRCMIRLHKKAMGLSHKGKLVNKIKVACAREMLGFIWESLTLSQKN